MDNRPPKSLRFKLPALVVLIGVCCTTLASAHEVIVFATVQGKTIEGDVYFHGGSPARNATVTVVGPGGEALRKTTADGEGKFAFEARFRCDHRLIADAGLGHQAEYTVKADELPRDLPLISPAGLPSEAEPTSPAKQDQPTAPPTMPGEDNLSEEIRALSQQIAALRKDLDRYKAKLRLQDILGGIGYILGIMGLVFYFLGVRRKEKGAAAGN